MATLAQIMRVRKIALKAVAQRMKLYDSAQEQVERFIKRLLTRRNKLPSAVEMSKIIRSMQYLDRLSAKVAQVANTAIEVFKNSADMTEVNTSRIQGIDSKFINQVGKDLKNFLTDMTNQLPTVGIGEMTKDK